jgi:hypothetical protein
LHWTQLLPQALAHIRATHPKPFLLEPLWNNVWPPISLRKLASNRPCSFGWLSTLS